MNRTTYGILTLLLNAYGVPCFIKGDVKTGILRIVLMFVTCSIIGLINAVQGIILGIKILKMTDEEFAAQYNTLDVGIPKMQ